MRWTTDYAIDHGWLYQGTIGGYTAKGFGGAAAYSFYQNNNSTAAVSASIPHPFQFNQDRQIQRESASLQRREQVLHLSALYAVPVGSNLISACPAVRHCSSSIPDFVDNVLYDETYPFDTATFRSTTTREVKKNQPAFTSAQT